MGTRGNLKKFLSFERIECHAVVVLGFVDITNYDVTEKRRRH